MDLFEVCRAAPNIIRVTLREPAIVHMPIRAATALETQSGGVFEPINITTNMPGTTTGMVPYAYTSVGGTSSVTGISMYGIYIGTYY